MPGRTRTVASGAATWIGAPGETSRTAVAGVDFIHASAIAKLVNIGTNLGALAVFAAGGHVWWRAGAAMAVCNIIGGILGARMAVRRGTGFVRAVLVGVVLALVALVIVVGALLVWLQLIFRTAVIYLLLAAAAFPAAIPIGLTAKQHSRTDNRLYPRQGPRVKDLRRYSGLYHAGLLLSSTRDRESRAARCGALGSSHGH